MNEPAPQFPVAARRPAGGRRDGRGGYDRGHYRAHAEAPGPQGGGDRRGHGRRRRDLAHQRASGLGAGRPDLHPAGAIRARERPAWRCGPTRRPSTGWRGPPPTCASTATSCASRGFSTATRRTRPGSTLLEQEAERQRRSWGWASSWQPGCRCPSRSSAALRFPHQAQFHPLRYLHGLAATIPGDGSVIYGGTRVLGVEDGEPCKVTTDRGTVTATPWWWRRTCPSATGCSCTPSSSRCAPTWWRSPRRSRMGAGLFWDTADPYHYWRTVRSRGETLMLIGGGGPQGGRGAGHRGRLPGSRGLRGRQPGPRGSGRAPISARTLVGSDHRTGGRAGLRRDGIRCPPGCSWPPATRATASPGAPRRR